MMIYEKETLKHQSNRNGLSTFVRRRSVISIHYQPYQTHSPAKTIEFEETNQFIQRIMREGIIPCAIKPDGFALNQGPRQGRGDLIHFSVDQSANKKKLNQKSGTFSVFQAPLKQSPLKIIKGTEQQALQFKHIHALSRLALFLKKTKTVNSNLPKN